MAPPEETLDSDCAGQVTPPAVPSFVSTLTRRADFQRASRAIRVATPGFIVQMRQRSPGEAEGIRVGFTCSKKVGNAVARNRAKRRLREVARLALASKGRAGCDYVLIGRFKVTAELPFADLQADFDAALDKLHARAS
jgi:ribonuclease P protein component